MVQILGISGKKQSGKNTLANHIIGKSLLEQELIKDFYLTDTGGLAVLTTDKTGVEDYGLLDVTRMDHGFISYAEEEIWPFVKLYSFAGGLKQLCMNFFGLTQVQVYGTDKQKNSPTKIKWEDTPTWKNSSLNLNRGYMTARELMQYFGTDIMRKMHEPVHVESTISKIMSEQTELAIIPDVRFPNEVEAIQNAGGQVIRLTRNRHKDSHSSECGLDAENFDWKGFDLVIENKGPLRDSIQDWDNMYYTFSRTGKLC
jgi:hypothetical protein